MPLQNNCNNQICSVRITKIEVEVEVKVKVKVKFKVKVQNHW